MVWLIHVSYVEEWLLELDQRSYERVIAALELLAEQGPGLGRPLVDGVRNSRHSQMKELRVGPGLRVLFAFDPDRQAVLLVAGDKRKRWKSWYFNAIETADDKFSEHLQQRKRRDP